MPTLKTLFKPGSGFAAAIATLAILATISSFSPMFEYWNHDLGDQLRVSHAEVFRDDIEVVYLDDLSLRRAEEDFGVTWPWPREAHGSAVNFLKRAGARAVIFDFLFTSASSYGEDDDLVFAKAIRNHGTVFAGLQATSSPQPESIARLKRQKKLHRLDVDTSSLPVFKGVDLPYSPLWESFKGIGDVHIKHDVDGINRRAPLLLNLSGESIGSLSLLAAWHLKGRPALSLEDTVLGIGEESFSVDEAGRMGLLFRNFPEGYEPVHLVDLVISDANQAEGKKPTIDPARFRNKIVFIASNAPGLLDLRPTPLDKRSPGVLSHMTLVDNLLEGRSLKSPELGAAGWLLVALLVFIVAMVSFRLPLAAMALPAGSLAMLAWLLGNWFYSSADTLIPLAAPYVGLALAFGLGGLEHYIAEGRHRRQVQGAFGKFLSPAVYKKLMEKGGNMDLGGEAKDLGIFFSDLQGFTSFSEKLDPHDLVEILNYYLTEMAEEVVGKYDGYVDKYIGDAVMAFWGAPVDHPNPALAACQAAWGCQLRLAKIQPRLAEMGLGLGEEGLVMRIGLHVGPAIVGLMGSPRKLNYTIIGDNVNLAARLEGANKAYGSRVMLSEETRKKAGDAIRVRELDLIAVKGKKEPTRVFELVGCGDNKAEDIYNESQLAAWEEALAAYRRRDFSAAAELFSKFDNNKAATVYLDRCGLYKDNPPPDDWNGVFVMTTK